MSAPLHPGAPGSRRPALLALAIVLLAPLALAVPRLWCRAAAMLSSADEPAGARRSLDSTRPVAGFAIVAHHIADLDLYLESVDRIADLGANALTVVTPHFQKHADSSDVRRVRRRCPTDEQLVAILRRAKARGLLTTIQPIVLIEEPGAEDWRGVIRPKDWERWWAGYGRMIDRFLGIARAANVDVFVIGSELNSTEDQVDRWQAVVDQVRARFDGQVTYSANWDRYDKVTMWRKFDAISVSSYFELERDRPDASREELARAWRPIRDKLIGFARQWEMPLLLSEVGYPSLPWAGAHPWNYVAKGERADHDAQARAYEAFFDAWTPTVAQPDGPVIGFVCYAWDPYHRGQSTDTGYGVQGKPAKGVIERGFELIRRQIAHSEPPATQPSTRPAD